MPDPIRKASYEVRVIGARHTGLGDAYHYAMRLPWTATLGVIVGGFLGLNVLFALVYATFGGIANARPGSLVDAFFFSIQTMGTIGYGVMSPVTPLANWLVVAESVCGLLVTAIATGLVFAKFSLPSSRVAFSHKATISPIDGVPTLQIRVGNERGNSISEATVRVDLMRSVTTAEGVRFYRMADLPMLRSRTPALTRSWTIFHAIDAASPLHGATPESFEREETEIVVSVVGTDDISYQPVHARYRYEAHEVTWGARHADVLAETPTGDLVMDVGRFHELVATEPTPTFPYPRA